jgi:hypothetical protein
MAMPPSPVLFALLGTGLSQAEALAVVARDASDALGRAVATAELEDALLLAAAVLADPAADPLDVCLPRPWHPCLAGKSVDSLSTLLRLWDRMALDARAAEAVYAHVAHRYARWSAKWQREVPSGSLRDGVLAWWAVRFGDGGSVVTALRAAAIKARMPLLASDLTQLAAFPCNNLRRLSALATRVAFGETVNAKAAASLGLVTRLRAAHGQGRPVASELMQHAARGGSVACLDFLRQQGGQWSGEVSEEAARAGNLEALQWLHESGCPLGHGVCSAAALSGHLDCLRYAHEHGCHLGGHVAQAAAQSGHLDCLRYAHEHGCPWEGATAEVAARNGRLACLQYAHDNGCPWDTFVLYGAAEMAHLDCLAYAHEHGLAWNAEVMLAAVFSRSLACVKYVHKHGGPWDGVTYRAAQRRGRCEDILSYMREQGCPQVPPPPAAQRRWFMPDYGSMCDRGDEADYGGSDEEVEDEWENL